MDNIEMLAEQIVTIIADMDTPIGEYNLVLQEIRKVMIRRLELVLQENPYDSSAKLEIYSLENNNE